MHCIQNTCIGTPSSFNKVTAGFTSCVLAITVIALSVIGLTTTPSGPFNATVQLGTATNGILLGTSIFILNLVWIGVLCKKTKEHSVSQSEPPLPALVPAIEEINSKDFLSQLPEEIILRALGFLSAIELAKCGEFSRRWRRLSSDPALWNAFDLRKISPLLKVFDKSDWVTHVDLFSFELDVEDEPLLDNSTLLSVLRRLSSLPIERKEGGTLLTIPKGLTLNKLVKLGLSPKAGNTLKYRQIWDHISNEIGDIEVDKTYRILITNNIFEKSRKLSVSDQKAFLETIDCKIPKVLEALALLVTTFMRSGERPYSDNPLTYTCCLEQLSGYQSVVGGFSPEGVRVYYSYSDYDYVGVGGILRKF